MKDETKEAWKRAQSKARIPRSTYHCLSLALSFVVAFLVTILLIWVGCRLIWG